MLLRVPDIKNQPLSFGKLHSFLVELTDTSTMHLESSASSAEMQLRSKVKVSSVLSEAFFES